MRIDLVLKYLCLAKSRSSVKSLCEKNAIWVNGQLAKPSSNLRVNDEVRVARPAGAMTISLKRIPEKQLSKTRAPSYYALVEPGEPFRSEDTSDS